MRQSRGRRYENTERDSIGSGELRMASYECKMHAVLREGDRMLKLHSKREQERCSQHACMQRSRDGN